MIQHVLCACTVVILNWRDFLGSRDSSRVEDFSLDFANSTEPRLISSSRWHVSRVSILEILEDLGAYYAVKILKLWKSTTQGCSARLQLFFRNVGPKLMAAFSSSILRIGVVKVLMGPLNADIVLVPTSMKCADSKGGMRTSSLGKSSFLMIRELQRNPTKAEIYTPREASSLS